MKDLRELINLCFESIEKRLNRGPRDSWNTEDFELLSKSIKEDTDVLLSLSTLKRLSGRVTYNSTPQFSTLNALARYNGYEDWRAFTNHTESNDIFVSVGKETLSNGKPRKSIRHIFIVGLFILAIPLLITHFTSESKGCQDYEDVEFYFSGKSVSSKMPNSVVFNYRVQGLCDNAKIEIQQDWDSRKRQEVSKDDSVATSIYYWPGYFKSKLVVNDSIFKEEDILVASDDWLATIETDSLPIYLDANSLQQDHTLSVNRKDLIKYGVDPLVSKSIVGLYQIRDFGEIHTTNFELSTKLRNSFKSGVNICQSSQLTILHEDGPINIMLTNKGCISEISLYAFNEVISGKNTDLSNFGVDLSQYVSLKCISKEQRLTIFIDDKEVYTFSIPESRKKIVGINFFFHGVGSVKDVELSGETGVVYKSRFKE